MRYPTYSEIKTKVQNDLDLLDEDFITATEMMGYCNEAIDEAEAEIHTIYEDYFLTSATISLVTGTSEYALPSDIYASKIRKIIYANGTEIYPIDRIRDWKKFEEAALIKQFGASDRYRYLIKNASAAAGVKLVLFPASRETSTNATIWYIRNANRITADSDPIDIPEFSSFVVQFMKVRCYEKEGHPNLQLAVAALDQQREQMVNTLTAMVPDNENEVEMDLSWYEDHS